MNSKITNVFKSTRKFLTKHSPEILTGIGVTGMFGTVIMAVQATPKALELIDAYKTTREESANIIPGETIIVPEPTKLEIIKIAWKPYIPAALLGIASATCIVGASAVNAKRNAALATAYAISERTLIKYRDKVIDTIGEKKEKDIREKIAQDEVSKKSSQDTQIIVTGKGNTLCMDSISGRLFRSDIDKIRKIVNELNRQLLNSQYISLQDFYNEIGLKPTKNSDDLGWNLDDGLIDVSFSSCITDDDEPCIVVDYMVAPRYEYYKFG